jgi:hypothetical protein
MPNSPSIADDVRRARLHTSERFSFTASAPMADVFPLLGADRERAWAPDWNPRFLWPATPDDRASMVFQVTRPQGTSTWVNTAFDPDAGLAQYVYVLPDVVATLITVQLLPQGAATEVRVHYERTSLTAEADAVVRDMATQDRAAGPEWARQINDYLLRSRPARA